MRKKIELLLILLVLTGLIICSRHLTKYVLTDKVETKKNTVVIDAGHGGSDPGKVGVNDALEKDINLEIARKVKKLLEKKGIHVIMTRKEDKALGDGQRGGQKVQDMRERVKLINKNKPELAVSIHQNSFHQADVHGAQVFYFKHSAEGEKYAGIMQEVLRTVDQGNTKQPKADDTYYLLKKTEIPIIIIECGFLSNPEEAEKLTTKEYQKEMAQAIADGITACLKD